MNTALLDSLPPQSIEAERNALGACLISSKAVPTVLATLRDEDFYSGENRRVFQAVFALFSREQPVDVFTVAEEMDRAGGILNVNTKRLIHELAETVPTASNAEYYSQVVAKKAALRQLIEIGGELIQAAFDQSEDDPNELRERFVMRLLSDKRAARTGPTKLADILAAEVFRVAANEYVPHMRFGIPELDNFCGGLECGDLGIIAGAPGCGKTALVHQCALNAAEDWGPGLIFSLEVSKEAAARRMLTRESGFEYRQLRDAGVWVGGKKLPFPHEDLQKLSRSASDMDTAAQRLWIDDRTYSLDGIVATAHEAKARSDIKFVVIDYAQLVEYRQAQKRNLEVEAITRAVKNRIAVDLDMPVIMVSSLTKEGQNRPGGATGADLAESGSLGYTASLILMLGKDPDGQECDGMRQVIADIAKCRNDRMGRVPLMFHPAMFLITGRDVQQTQEREAGRKDVNG